MNALTSWLGQHAHLWAVALLIALVVFHYLTRFVAPAMRLQHTLAQAIERAGGLEAAAVAAQLDAGDINSSKSIKNLPRPINGRGSLCLWGLPP